MNKRGQGALEYLLLIGGAIVVAVVVVTLLLNLGSRGGGTAGATSMGAISSQYAATAGNATPVCTDVTTSSAANNADNFIWNATTSECWAISGTYPSCTATKAVATTDDACGNNTGPDLTTSAGTGHQAGNLNI